MDKVPELKKTAESKTPSYALTEADFSNQPSIISPYKVGSKVNRENFGSLLIFSFAISRGKFPVQREFFKYLEHKEGFDFKKTFQSFINSKQWKVFTYEEKLALIEAYKKVIKHRNRMFDAHLEEYIADEVSNVAHNLAELSEVNDEENVGMSQLFDLKSMHNFSDFTKAANIYIEESNKDKEQRGK